MKRILAALLLCFAVNATAADPWFYGAWWTTTVKTKGSTKDAGEFTVKLYDYGTTNIGRAEIELVNGDQNGGTTTTYFLHGEWVFAPKANVALIYAKGDGITPTTFKAVASMDSRKLTGRWFNSAGGGKIQAVRQ